MAREFKKCFICKKDKPVSEWGRCATRHDGLQNYCRECKNDWSRKNFKVNGEKVRAQGRRYHLALRRSVLEHYGNKCVCCGESEYKFLSMDHIGGGGVKHRKQINTNIYQWLKVNKFPKGFQPLCYNCNCAKGFYGSCPHNNL